jgi:hypothetical protein
MALLPVTVRLYDFAQDIAWKLNDSQGKFTVSVWRFRRSSSHCANLGVAFFHPRFQARVEAQGVVPEDFAI